MIFNWKHVEVASKVVMMNRKSVFAWFNACLALFIVIIVITVWDLVASYLALFAWFWAFIGIGIFLEWEFYRWMKGARFLHDMRSQKIYFVIALSTHFFGYYLQAIIPFLVSISSCSTCQYTDFIYVYLKGVQILLTNPSSLFTANLFTECRRAPSLLLYYMIFNALPWPTNFLAQSLVMLYCDLGSCYMIFQICKLEKIKQLQVSGFLKSPFILAGTYIVYFGFFFGYLLGVSYSIAAFFVIVAFYYFYKGPEHLGYFFLGVSVTFMLNPVVWIFFLILKKPFKQLIKNLVFVIISLLPSIIMFLAWPNLIFDFIPCNIKYAQSSLEVTNISGTLSSNLMALFHINLVYSALISIIIIVPITFLVINRRPLQFHDRLMIVALATMSIIPDFDAGHVLYLMIPYLFWLSMKSPDISIKIKVIPFVPTTIFIIWFYFPFMSLFYIIPLILIYAIFLKKMLQERKTRNSLRGAVPELVTS